MHNPAALRCLMPCCHPQCFLCGKTIFWHQCVNIIVSRCFISRFCPIPVVSSSFHVSAAIFLFDFPHFFSFLSIPLHLPFLPFRVQFLLCSFSSSFSLKLSGLRMVVVVEEGAVITPSQTLVQCIYTLTLSWCLRAAGALIETNGKITQAAVLNNSLHSHLSGSMLLQWEPGCWGGWLVGVWVITGREGGCTAISRWSIFKLTLCLNGDIWTFCICINSL